MYYRINEESARRANDANSHSDYESGSATATYTASVNDVFLIAEQAKKDVDPEYHDEIDYYADLYARKLAANINERNEIEARVPSILVCGAGNFPVEKKRKQNAAREKNWEEYDKIQKIIDKIRRIGHGGIMSDDKNAIVKLEHKLEKLESTQAMMKSVNAYYRKNGTLDGCPNITDDEISKLKVEMSASWHIEDKPYPSFMLTNNNANIRRTRQRIDELKREAERQSETDSADKQYDGFILRENADICRIQFIFDGKPDDETRTLLKSYGFHWSPKEKAWQRPLNENGRRAAEYIAKVLNGGD